MGPITAIDFWIRAGRGGGKVPENCAARWPGGRLLVCYTPLPPLPAARRLRGGEGTQRLFA